MDCQDGCLNGEGKLEYEKQRKKKREILLYYICSATIFYLLGNKIISWCWF